MKSPEERASILSQYMFWWVRPTLIAANRDGYLHAADLPSLPVADDPGPLAAKLRARWVAGKGSLLYYAVFSLHPQAFWASFLNGTPKSMNEI